MRLAKGILAQRGLLVSIAKTWHGHHAAELVFLGMDEEVARIALSIRLTICRLQNAAL